MVYFDAGIAGKSCICDCSPSHRQIGPHGSNAMVADDGTDVSHHVAGTGDVAERCSSVNNLRLQMLLSLGPLTGKSNRVAFECNSSLHYELAFGWVEWRTDRH